MGSSPPDVRVRLSAEGQQEIIKAFRQVQAEAEKTGKVGSRGLNALSDSARQLARFLPALTFGAAIAGATLLAKRALEAGDRFAKLSRTTGVSVETLSAYAHAANLADVDLEVLARGLAKLARNMNEAAQGSASALRPFKALGIAIKKDDGSLRSLDDVLGDLADRFANMEEGAGQLALATEIFGQRVGPGLLPFLQMGRAGLAELRAEAERLGIVWSEKDAIAAEQFNDNLKRLQATVGGFVKRELADLLPLLNEVAERLLKIGDKTSDTDSLVTRATGNILAYSAVIKALAASRIGPTLLINPLEFSRRLQKELEEARAFVAAFFSELPKPPERPKKPPPKPTDDTAIAAAQKLADAQLALTRAQLDNELKLLQAHNKLATDEDKRRFEQGLLSLQEFFRARAAALEEEGAKEIAILEAQAEQIRKRLEETRTRPLTAKETAADRAAEGAKLEKELAEQLTSIELRRLQLQGERNALAGDERDAARKFGVEQFKSEQQLAAAQGDRFAAERAQLEAQLAGLERLKGESDAAFEARKQALAELGKAHIHLAELEQQAADAMFALEGERLQIQLQVQQGQIGELEGQERIAALDQARLPLLRQIAEAMRAAAITPEEIQRAEDFSRSLDELGASSNLAGQRMAELRSGIEDILTSGFTDFFTSIITGTEDAGEAFKKLAQTVLAALTQMIVKMLVTLAVQKLLGSVFGLAEGGLVPEGASPGGFAAGGLVPGTGAADTVPARLTPGEYVVKAPIVRRPGMLEHLRFLNDDLQTYAKAGSLRRLGRVQGFAAGGLVEGGLAGTTEINIDARGADGGVEARLRRAMAGLEARAARRALLAMEDRRLRTP